MHDPCYSGFQVQGAANSPICMALLDSLIYAVSSIDLQHQLLYQIKVGFAIVFLIFTRLLYYLAHKVLQN